MTLFAHVISEPLNPTAADDIALMEVVNGLFGHLKFLSSGLTSLGEAKEFARLAQLAVHNAKAGAGDPILSADSGLVDATQSPRSALEAPRREGSVVGAGVPDRIQPTTATYQNTNCHDFALTPFTEAIQEYLNFRGHEPEPEHLDLDMQHLNGAAPTFFNWGSSSANYDNQNQANGFPDGYDTQLGMAMGAYEGI
jgi:hypothetical protein